MDILVSEISATLNDRAASRVTEQQLEDASTRYLLSEFVLSQAERASEASDMTTDLITCEELKRKLDEKCEGHTAHLRLIEEARTVLVQRYKKDYNTIALEVSEIIRPAVEELLPEALQKCHGCTTDESLLPEVRELYDRKFELQNETQDAKSELEILQSEINNQIKQNAITMCNVLSRYRIPAESMDKSVSDYLLALVEALQRKIHVLSADINLTVYNERTIPALRQIRDTILDLTNSTILEQRALEALTDQYNEIDEDPEYHLLDEQYRRLERVRANLESS